MRAMTLRLPDNVHEQLRKEAYESRRSMNELVLEALTARDVLVARAVRAELEWSEAAGQLDSMTEEWGVGGVRRPLIADDEETARLAVRRSARGIQLVHRLVTRWVEVPDSEDSQSRARTSSETGSDSHLDPESKGQA